MMVDVCWVILHALLSSDDVFKINFKRKTSGTNTIRVSNGECESDQASTFI